MDGPHKLYVQDLLFPEVLRLRLAAVRAYYSAKTGLPADWEELETLFIYAVEEVLPTLEVVQERRFFQEQRYETYLFEGSQGILLDMDHGFFPHVTRARTTSRQAWELIKANGLPDPEIYYVTRAYQTRHGNGPLSNENWPLILAPTPLETNQYNPWQGHQRRSVLDAGLLNYALTCDANYGTAAANHLVVTCLDQLVEPLWITVAGILQELASGQELLTHLDTRFRGYWESWSDCAAGLQQVVDSSGRMNKEAHQSQKNEMSTRQFMTL
jgi:adenylosuccinate synthase